MNGFGAVSFLVGAVGENVDQLAMFSWLEIELARRHETGAIRYIILPPSRGSLRPDGPISHIAMVHGFVPASRMNYVCQLGLYVI